VGEVIMNFLKFSRAVAKQFADMQQYPMFRTNTDRDEVIETYLGAFPAGTNPIYRERTEHDCSCCKSFIRAVGNAVAIVSDGSSYELQSIWDIHVDDEYQVVADALSNYVKSKAITNVFVHDQTVVGQEKSFEQLVDNVHTYHHFHVNIPASCVNCDAGSMLSKTLADFDVFERSLRELSVESVETVLELIAQNSLYRGEEHKFALNAFLCTKQEFDGLSSEQQKLVVWYSAHPKLKVSGSVLRIRNTAIGTLLIDLSEGKEIDQAVRAYEQVVAPANYKRPTALVTPKMVAAAKEKIAELGMTSALERRYATLSDISVNEILFADRSVKKVINPDVFDALIKDSAKNVKVSSNTEQIGIDEFIAKILPTASAIEVLVDNKHVNNFLSLVAPSDPTAELMFKWSNAFSWSYNGNFADSIKERVKAAGGNVTGEVCCRLAWEYTDDLDFHMVEPCGHRIYFSNRRRLSMNGGMLDVDANGMDGIRPNPVENIFYEKVKTMQDGAYHLIVDNYSRRSEGIGFEVEIEVAGVVHSFAYDKVLQSCESVKVAILHVKGGVVTVEPKLPSTTTSKDVWGLKTMQYTRVDAIMFSPNYWGENGVGNKHVFFMLNGCVNEGEARGFYNEFLKESLTPHRKVLEMVGAKVKTGKSNEQLSGLGFSLTQRSSVLVRVTGAFTRTLQVNI
jgi:hypothetical protein